MKVSEILKAAKDLIADPKHLSRGAFARDKFEICVPPASQRAVSWCTMGAVIKAQQDLGQVAFQCLDAESFVLLDKHMNHSIDNFNDSKSHDEIMQAFDAAISDALSQGI